MTAGEVAPAIEAASVALAAGAIRIDCTVVKPRRPRTPAREILDNLYEGLQSKSRHDDFSDLPQESLQHVMRAQTLVDRVAAGTTYAAKQTECESRNRTCGSRPCGLSLSQCALRGRGLTLSTPGPTHKAALQLPLGTVPQADPLPCGPVDRPAGRHLARSDADVSRTKSRQRDKAAAGPATVFAMPAVGLPSSDPSCAGEEAGTPVP